MNGLYLSFSCPQGADASHQSRLLPAERGGALPRGEPDPLHAALQSGRNTTRAGPTLQVTVQNATLYILKPSILNLYP